MSSYERNHEEPQHFPFFGTQIHEWRMVDTALNTRFPGSSLHKEHLPVCCARRQRSRTMIQLYSPPIQSPSKRRPEMDLAAQRLPVPYSEYTFASVVEDSNWAVHFPNLLRHQSARRGNAIHRHRWALRISAHRTDSQVCTGIRLAPASTNHGQFCKVIILC